MTRWQEHEQWLAGNRGKTKETDMTTETTRRYATGGFEDRFRVTRTDGKPIGADRRYIVLDYANDPHARKALTTYANSVESENPQMAADIIDALENPEKYPSQHD